MNIYEILQEIITVDQRRLTMSAFTEEKLSELSEERDKKIYILLRNLASLGVKFKNGNIEVYPYFITADGKRSFSVEDLSEDDYALLRSLEFDKIPKLLQIRVADILWKEKRDYKMALLSARLSYELYLSFFDVKEWTTCFNFVSHAVNLSAQLKAEELNTYLQEINEKIIELNGEDSSLLSLSLINLLISSKWADYTAILTVLDNIIAQSFDKEQKSERAFDLKTKILYKQGNPEAAMENNRAFARYLEKKADIEDDNNIQGLFMAKQYLEKAVHIYRNNGSPEDGKRVHFRLMEIQKRIPQYMITITESKDMTKHYEAIQGVFSGLSFKESVVNLSYFTQLYKKDSLREDVLEDAANPLTQFFTTGLMSSTGQTLANIPAINVQNPDERALEQHMYWNMVTLAEMEGNTVLNWAMTIIKANYTFSMDDLQFIVKNNPIIPPGRERIFLSGLYYGLMGDLYVALHILAPQVENLFRCLAETFGANMSTLDDDNLSEAKTLTSIFDAPELVDCYDNDILFLIKGLMNEKTGANIRNEIAHGIMSEQKGNSGVARFFFCWVLKLLSFTSKECQDTIRNILEKTASAKDIPD